ncbi:MAG: glycosyltransferase family 2 protein [Nitrosomonas sp.]|nr:glycosyltransferase family 2 protein [Nitrosomonas sp.]
MPCYNHQEYIQEAIYGVINQTYANIELIILNDGSKDGSHEKILELEDICKARFTHFHYINKLNEGVAATLNRGLILSSGVYIATCSSDDRYVANYIEAAVNEFAQLDDSFAMLTGNANFIDDLGREIYFDENHKIVYDREKAEFISLKELTYDYDPVDFIRGYGSYRHVISGRCGFLQATMFVKQALIDVGMYGHGNRVEDVGLCLKIAKKYKAKYIDCVLYNYRLHGENSVMLCRADLSKDIIRLLLTEKEYCLAHGLKTEWRIRAYTELITILRGGEFGFVSKFLMKESAGQFALYVVTKAVKKIKKRFGASREVS